MRGGWIWSTKRVAAVCGGSENIGFYPRGSRCEVVIKKEPLGSFFNPSDRLFVPLEFIPIGIPDCQKIIEIGQHEFDQRWIKMTSLRKRP